MHDCGGGRRIAYAGPETVWPPGGQYVPLDTSAHDDGGGAVRLTTTATHDETRAASIADGSTQSPLTRDIEPPASVVAFTAGAAQTRHSVHASRWSLGDGRVYTVEAFASFADGQTCTARFTTEVPVDPPAGASDLPQVWNPATDPAVSRRLGNPGDDGTWRISPPDGTGFALVVDSAPGVQGPVKLSVPTTLVDGPGENHRLAVVRVVDALDLNTILAEASVYRHMFKAVGERIDVGVPFAARPDRQYSLQVLAEGKATLALGTLALDRDTPEQALAQWRGADAAVDHETGARQGDGWQAVPATHLPGELSRSRTSSVRGTARAVVRLQSQDGTGKTAVGAQSPAPLATFEVLVGGVVSAARDVFSEDFVQAGVGQDFALDFTATPGEPVDVRIAWTGLGVLRHDETRIEDPAWPQRWAAAGPEVAHETGSSEGEVWAAAPGRHPAGVLATGPVGQAASDLHGTGQAVFQLAVADNAAADDVVGRVRVAQDGVTLIERQLYAGDFRAAGRFQDVRLAYLAERGRPVELRVEWAGTVPLSVAELRVEARRLSQHPGFAEVWNSTAKIVTTAGSPVGAPPGAHIADVQFVQNGSLVYAYYTTPDGSTRVKQRGQSGAVALAISSDGGKTFVPYRGGRPVVEAGAPGDFDALHAVSPAVVRNGDEWVLAYEGYGAVYGEGVDNVQRTISPYNPGVPAGHGPPTIGWATSKDGINWTKRGVVARDLAWTSWESLGIGSPSLTLWNGTFHLWYTGFRYPGYALARGFSFGPSLDMLTKEPANPVLLAQPGSWDAGAVGRNSVTYDGDWYWMWYEGGRNPWCNATSQWGVGLARSRDLRTWERWHANPVHRMPQQNGCWSAYASTTLVDGRLSTVWLGEGIQAMRDEIR